MWTVSVQKTFTDPEGEETLYVFTSTNTTEELAFQTAILYASMVEYGVTAEEWQPDEMFFPREQLYQFIQPDILEAMENMYPNIVASSYASALAYIHSYIGNMFDVDTMLQEDNTTSTALTLRLALLTSTAIYILGSSPQYSDVLCYHKDQLSYLLRGLKTGTRNFGKDAIIAEPNVRISVVKLAKTSARP